MSRSVVALACSLAVGCAVHRPSPAELAARSEDLAKALAASASAIPPGALVVRLAFGAEADLDLYVTDAANESVYFGNSPSASGGELLADLRCGAPAPRIESIVFERRRAGSVRVGVDAPERCREDVRVVPFVVEMRAGEQRIERRGVATPGRFEVIVLEAEVDGDAPPARNAP